MYNNSQKSPKVDKMIFSNHLEKVFLQNLAKTFFKTKN